VTKKKRKKTKAKAEPTEAELKAAKKSADEAAAAAKKAADDAVAKGPPPTYVDGDGATYRCVLPQEEDGEVCNALLQNVGGKPWCHVCKVQIDPEAAKRVPKPTLPEEAKKVVEEAAKTHAETKDTAPPPEVAPKAKAAEGSWSKKGDEVLQEPPAQPYPEKAPTPRAQAVDPGKAAEIAQANVPRRPTDRQPKYKQHAHMRIPGGFTGRAVKVYGSLQAVYEDESLKQYGVDQILRGPHGGPPSTVHQCFYLCVNNGYEYPMVVGELDAHMVQQGTEEWD
jgi:hypothetical protein